MNNHKNTPIHESTSKKSYVALEYHLLNSEPYKILHRKYPVGHSIFMGFSKRIIKRKIKFAGKKGKRGRYEAVNRKKLIYPYKDMIADSGAKSRSTITRNIDHLVELGFIDIIHQGGLGKGDFTIYALSDRWEMYGKPSFVKAVRLKGIRHSESLKRYQEIRSKEIRLRKSKSLSISVPPRPRTYTFYPDGTVKRKIKRRHVKT